MGPHTSHLAARGIHAMGCSHLTVLSERLTLLTPHSMRAAAPIDCLAVYPEAAPPCRAPLTEALSGHRRARMAPDQALAQRLLIACPQPELYRVVRLLPHVTTERCLPPS
jgi:hypothetical protein